MTLRSRMALLVGAIAALAMLVGGFLSYAAVSDEQYDTVDRFLQRGHRPEEFDRFRDPPEGVSPFDRVRPQVDDGVTFQANTAEGELVVSSNSVIELDMPRPDELGMLRTIDLDGERFRVSAETTADGNIVQVARSLAEADATVAAIRNRLWMLGVIVALVAAALGWLVAGWISRPLERLTGVVGQIARTADLDVVETPVGDASTRFEVSRLSAGFSAMVEALRSSREQQQQLVADAGHEMRTPLTTVRTNAELLQSGRLSADDRARSLEAIVREVDELTNLTNELVELSTANGDGEQRRDVDLYDVAAAASDRARSRHSREIVLQGGPATISGRPAGLDRAVTNLIDNAAKFSPPGTPIHVLVEPGRVSVRDLGPGIAAEDSEHVFERFYRAETARTMPGSGLGLAIVAKIADDHGGVAFVAEPIDGKGAVVGFTVATS